MSSIIALFRIFCLIVGLGATVGCAIASYRTLNWLGSTTESTGVVIEHKSRHSRKGGRSTSEVVRFTDGQGAEHEFKTGVSTSSPFKIGTTVPIRFDPSDPTRAEINTTFRNWFIPMFLGGFALFFTFFGALAKPRRKPVHGPGTAADQAPRSSGQDVANQIPSQFR